MTENSYDQELLELQREYLTDMRETIGMIKQHGRSLTSRTGFKSAFPVLLYLSHQLKGSGGSLGFPEITSLAQKMNAQLNDFLDDTVVRPSPKELSQTVATLAADLERTIAAAEQRIG